MEKQTNWANVVCIAALVLGFFGMCCNLFGTGGLVVSEQAASLTPEQTQMMQAQAAYRPFLWVAQGLGILQSGFLMVASGLALRDLETHRALARTAFKVSIGVIALELCLSMIVQLKQLQVAMPDVPGSSTMHGVLQIAGWFGIVFSLVWACAKIGFFVFGDRYLGKPQREADVSL